MNNRKSVSFDAQLADVNTTKQLKDMICHFRHSSDKQSNTSSLPPNINSCIIILLHSILIF